MALFEEGVLCCKIKTATIFFAVWVICSGAFALLLEILDIAAQADSGFDISGGFRATWRMHVWEGWLACNIVMVVCHLFMIGASILLIFAVKRFPTYYEFNLTKGYLALLVIYIIVELGTSCYKYSWYGPNTFRLPFLVFSFLFWLVRSLINITGGVIVSSRIAVVDYEITFGEKKNLGPYGSAALLMQSGMVTPGAMTPRSYPHSMHSMQA